MIESTDFIKYLNKYYPNIPEDYLFHLELNVRNGEPYSALQLSQRLFERKQVKEEFGKHLHPVKPILQNLQKQH